MCRTGYLLDENAELVNYPADKSTMEKFGPCRASILAGKEVREPEGYGKGLCF